MNAMSNDPPRIVAKNSLMADELLFVKEQIDPAFRFEVWRRRGPVLEGDGHAFLRWLGSPVEDSEKRFRIGCPAAERA